MNARFKVFNLDGDFRLEFQQEDGTWKEPDFIKLTDEETVELLKEEELRALGGLHTVPEDENE